MAKNTTKTRKRALAHFHDILRARRTDESNPSLRTQQRILSKKMKAAKKRALQEQREKTQQTTIQNKIIQQAADGYIPEPTILTEKLPDPSEFQLLQDCYDLPSTQPTFKEIIKHGGF